MKTLGFNQCVVVIDKSTIQTVGRNRWLDNMHIVLTREFVGPAAAAVTVSGGNYRSAGSNIFLTRMTFLSAHEASVRALRVMSPGSGLLEAFHPRSLVPDPFSDPSVGFHAILFQGVNSILGLLCFPISVYFQARPGLQT